MSFKNFCDENGYKPESRKNPKQAEFRSAKKAWLEQQAKIDKLQAKIDTFHKSFRDLIY